MYPNFVRDLLFQDPLDFQTGLQPFLDIKESGSFSHLQIVETLIEAGETLLERYNEQTKVSFANANPDLLYKAEICADAAGKICSTNDQTRRAPNLQSQIHEEIQVVEDSFDDYDPVPAPKPDAPAPWQP